MNPQRIAQPSSISRSATQGYAQIPNSIIENQSMLTPAELALVLIVCRRGEATVSDRHWEDWTGKSSRIKDHAAQGLKAKGLSVSGRGNSAKYFFDRNQWDSWVRSRPRRERAHTSGRSKSVSAKPGMQVHPECQERGCSRLCETKTEPKPAEVISITSVPATHFEKPVSQTSISAATKDPPRPKIFPLTLEALQKFFPHVDEDFVLKLREAASKAVKHVTDAELADAVRASRKRSQHSEGLFLLTVPKTLAVARQSQSSTAPADASVPIHSTIQQALKKTSAGLRKAGHGDIADIVEAVDLDGLDVLDLDAQVEQANQKILALLYPRLKDQEHIIEVVVDKELKPYRSKMMASQLERLRKQFFARAVFEAAGVPKIEI